MMHTRGCIPARPRAGADPSIAEQRRGGDQPDPRRCDPPLPLPLSASLRVAVEAAEVRRRHERPQYEPVRVPEEPRPLASVPVVDRVHLPAGDGVQPPQPEQRALHRRLYCGERGADAAQHGGEEDEGGEPPRAADAAEAGRRQDKDEEDVGGEERRPVGEDVERLHKTTAPVGGGAPSSRHAAWWKRTWKRTSHAMKATRAALNTTMKIHSHSSAGKVPHRADGAVAHDEDEVVVRLALQLPDPVAERRVPHLRRRVPARPSL
eukprot:gene8552-biopygen308